MGRLAAIPGSAARRRLSRRRSSVAPVGFRARRRGHTDPGHGYRARRSVAVSPVRSVRRERRIGYRSAGGQQVPAMGHRLEFDGRRKRFKRFHVGSKARLAFRDAGFRRRDVRDALAASLGRSDEPVHLAGRRERSVSEFLAGSAGERPHYRLGYRQCRECPVFQRGLATRSVRGERSAIDALADYRRGSRRGADHFLLELLEHADHRR